MKWCRCTLCLLILFGYSTAQYFGRNKVQYEQFDFKELRTERFRIFTYQPESSAITDAARMLERWRTRLDGVFRNPLSDDQIVVLYANHADFQQTNVIPGLIPQTTGGVTEGMLRRIVVPLTGLSSENDHILGHELAHAYHFSIMNETGSALVAGGTTDLPLWFIEGMAEYLSLGARSPLTAMWMRDAVLHQNVPTLLQIGTREEYFPYRYGHAVWAYIAGRWGDGVVDRLFREALRYGMRRAFTRVLGIELAEVSRQWQEETQREFPVEMTRTDPSELGELLIGDDAINLSPSISPDGKYIAFSSSRGLFTIDLYLADGRTGRVIRRISSSLSDEHFDALRFFNASGTWSPDGSELAFTVFRDGDNAVSIIRVPSGEIVRTFKLEGVGEITQLAWSPDGRYLAVAGSSGGVSDLYLYDLHNDTFRNLTGDRYAQLQPAWSPDGTMLAYVTDESPLTDFDSLTYAPTRIAFLDVITGKRTSLSIGDWVTHTNPHFGMHDDLYLIANPDGISNIYRYSFETDLFTRITNVATGISGLTQHSPAMSIAVQTGRIVCSVFSRSDYQIRAIEPSKGTPFQADSSEFISRVSLPPKRPQNTLVSDYLDSPQDGLRKISPQIRDYRPQFSLAFVGQTFAGFSVDRFGIGLGAGITFLFSDILGDHFLGLGAQLSGQISDFGGELLYLNRNYRVNWGIGFSRIPSAVREQVFGIDTISIDGEPVPVNTLTLIDRRLFDNRIRLWTEYPISINRRFELAASYSRISYDFSGEIVRGTGQQILQREEIPVEDPRSLNIFIGGLAYVGDFSFFGYTSPVYGRRFRFEVEPTWGTLLYFSALADYRQYLFLRPLTLAFRLFHYGRYLRDSEDERLSDLFLGNQTFVRGYASNSFDLQGCSVDQGFQQCPEFDRLLGSRIGVGNVELRIPLLGSDRFGLIPFPYFPVEVAGFFDAGVAWRSDDAPHMILAADTNRRIPVFSTGAAVRLNVLNAFVFQFYGAYPFQRSDTNWEFGFVIVPGW